ncbi:MAG: sigma-E processing peptidase SpoIIGA [Clostridia bacterium]|nr:sigma-E processing peptidase SpoIIGA [Clostridia bacterium]
MDVYADVLFLINGGMDALCLCLTAKLLHRPIPLGRLLLSSALGGVYGVAALFLEVGTMMALAIDLIVCVLMCVVAMGWSRLWLTGGLYVLTSMVMGGVMTALYHWLNRAGLADLLPTGEEGASSVAFVILALAGGLFTLIWGKIFKSAERRRALRVTVTVTLAEQTLSFAGMVDSGNLLTDPLSGAPVIVVKREVMEPMMSPELKAILSESPLPVASIAELPEGERLRLIPANTATGKGMLIAIRPDAVALGVEGRKTTFPVKAVLCPIPLEGAAAEAMVPSELLT